MLWMLCASTLGRMQHFSCVTGIQHCSNLFFEAFNSGGRRAKSNMRETWPVSSAAHPVLKTKSTRHVADCRAYSIHCREMARVGTSWARSSEAVRHQEATLSDKLGVPVEIMPIKFESLALSAQFLAQDIALTLHSASEKKTVLRCAGRISGTAIAAGITPSKCCAQPCCASLIAGKLLRRTATTSSSRTATSKATRSGKRLKGLPCPWC